MFILNKKTGMIQQCHNNDAIKSCRKDPETYAVAERAEDLLDENARRAENGAEKEKKGNPSNGLDNPVPGACDGQQEPEECNQYGMELTEDALNERKVAELKIIAKERGIQGYANMDKQTLVAMILNH